MSQTLLDGLRVRFKETPMMPPPFRAIVCGVPADESRLIAREKFRFCALGALSVDPCASNSRAIESFTSFIAPAIDALYACAEEP